MRTKIDLPRKLIEALDSKDYNGHSVVNLLPLHCVYL